MCKQECIPVGYVPAAHRSYLGGRGVPGPGGYTWSRGCTWSGGGVPGPGGCTWSWGVYLVWGGIPGLGGVPGPGGTWSGGEYLSWGVPSLGGYLVRGVPGLGGYLVWGRGYLVLGGYLSRYSPPVNRITHACENITLAQLRCGRCTVIKLPSLK